MKVQCTRIINELTQDEPPPAVHKERLTVGKCYDVFEVAFDHRANMCWYRIECDDGKPWLILATQFQIISNKLPQNWVVSEYDGGITFSPASWLPSEEFWEKLFAGDTEARRTYEDEAENGSLTLHRCNSRNTFATACRVKARVRGRARCPTAPFGLRSGIRVGAVGTKRSQKV